MKYLGRDDINNEQRYFGRGSHNNGNRGRGINAHRGGNHHGRNNDRGGRNHNQHPLVAGYFNQNNEINNPRITNVLHQPNNPRHITVLSANSSNRNSAVNRTTASSLLPNNSARGIVVNGNDLPQPLSDRVVQILSFGDALAARAASAAADNSNLINLANSDEASSGQINNQNSNIQSSVLGPGAAVDNVAGEVVVQTSAAGPSDGGSEAAAGAIYVSSGDEDDSGQ
jgi:hypothetical protein